MKNKKGTIFIGILIAMQISLCAASADTPEPPVIMSEAAVVIDQDTGKMLYGKNENALYYPASITKLLTALVVAEECNLDDTVIFSYDAVYDVEEGSGNKLSLEAGDKLTVRDCLYAMILESSNQAANALAEYTAGSREAFVTYMQGKLLELNCSLSNFVNPSGLNDPQQKTTALEMAEIARAAFANEEVNKICSAREYELSPTLHNPQGYPLTMEHQLLNDSVTQDYPYAVAGKTGYTSVAGNTLVTSAQKDGQGLIAVVLKSDQTHYEDTINLFDYGFALLEQGGPELLMLSEEPQAEDAAMLSKEEPVPEGNTRWSWYAAVAGVFVSAAGAVFWLHIRRVRARRRTRRVLRNRRKTPEYR